MIESAKAIVVPAATTHSWAGVGRRHMTERRLDVARGSDSVGQSVAAVWQRDVGRPLMASSAISFAAVVGTATVPSSLTTRNPPSTCTCSDAMKR